MGITIDESISWITESILDMRKSQLCISDKLALKTAVDTMCKYQKIQEIVKNTQQLCSYGSAFIDIREVVEDGSNNN